MADPTTVVEQDQGAPDDNPICLCGDRRLRHRGKRGGCKDCGCDRFETAADQAETERVLTVVADVCEDQAAKARTELAARRAAGAIFDAVFQVPEVIDRWDAWLCRTCGSRYTTPDRQHGCGPLQPVTVTITAQARA